MTQLIMAVGVSALAILIYMTLIWGLSLVRKDSGIVDIFWGPGFVVAMASVYWFLGDISPRGILVAGLVSIWALRLAVHIGVRNIGKPEDFRYAQWRAAAGDEWWWRSYLKVFLLQGAVMTMVAVPLVFSMNADGWDGWSIFDIFGAQIWLVGFIFEAVGDEQLRRFKSKPENAGRVLDHGLWRYSRHPNYFGEAVLWWGFFLLAFSALYGFLTIFSPVLMTFLLLKVSGVVMLEKGLENTKPAYRDYIERTSAFIPGPRKS